MLFRVLSRLAAIACAAIRRGVPAAARLVLWRAFGASDNTPTPSTATVGESAAFSFDDRALQGFPLDVYDAQIGSGPLRDAQLLHICRADRAAVAALFGLHRDEPAEYLLIERAPAPVSWTENESASRPGGLGKRSTSLADWQHD